MPMMALTLTELSDRWSAIEAAADATDGVDHWCSGPDWFLSVAAGFGGDAVPLIVESDDGFVLCAHYRTDDDTTVIAGLEPLWGFAFPLVGPDPTALAKALAQHLTTTPGLDQWRAIVLPGAPGADHHLTRSVGHELTSLGRVHLAEGITRQVAEIDDVDRWVHRRSPRFRRNLRRAIRANDNHPEPIRFLDASDDPSVFQRMLAIERRSWKGLDHTGIVSPEMATMYATITDRLQERGRLQVHIAHLPNRGVDVGFILGGIRNQRYRGLQVSYTAEVTDRSVGHLLQYHQIQHLSHHRLATTYDMGMDIDYKRRWADRAEPSTMIVVTPL